MTPSLSHYLFFAEKRIYRFDFLDFEGAAGMYDISLTVPLSPALKCFTLLPAAELDGRELALP